MMKVSLLGYYVCVDEGLLHQCLQQPYRPRIRLPGQPGRLPRVSCQGRYCLVSILHCCGPRVWKDHKLLTVSGICLWIRICLEVGDGYSAKHCLEGSVRTLQ
jgi:hypothetical protein